MATKDCNCGCPDCSGLSAPRTSGAHLPLPVLGMPVTPGMTADQQRAALIARSRTDPNGAIRNIAANMVGAIDNMKRKV